MKKNIISEFSLNKKVALVTGAGQGLGKWISKGLANAGAIVVSTDINLEKAQETSKEIRDTKKDSFAIKLNVCDINSIKTVAEKVVERYGRVDILVNNAGINIRKPIVEINEQDFDSIVNVNFKGVYFTSQIFAKEMMNLKKGKIINISSAAGILLRNTVPYSVYAATKAAVIMVTKAFALEFAPHKICVNAVAPGYFETPLAEKALENKKIRNGILSFTPLNKIGRGEDLIGAVIFLASDASNFITGQTISVDGGRTIL